MLWFASNGHRAYQAPNRPWYRSKTRASLADMPATLRCQSLKEQVSSYYLPGRGNRKVIETLVQALQRAAQVRKSNLGSRSEIYLEPGLVTEVNQAILVEVRADAAPQA